MNATSTGEARISHHSSHPQRDASQRNVQCSKCGETNASMQGHASIEEHTHPPLCIAISLFRDFLQSLTGITTE
ncbi:hypothetical protein M513_03057 [Trichuris suis]|uniref:Uncharacterized protein n=1 Tax=Trichuris suis TaxID=68888 RepID=A0A085MFD7_9BILA|nr:hypothetical protein M513_03057 [Trichuris suis]